MNYKNIFRLFIMFVVITCSTALFAQTDYSKVKVDQLSDAQVKQMMQRADEMKYTDAQLEQLMSSQGMAADEVSKLRSRIEKIRAEAGSASGGNVDISGRTVNSGGSETSSKPGTAKINSRIFGAELFSNGSITFEPDMRMATPKGYVIGPDDQLLLDITGDNLASYKLKVSPEGYINVEYVGRVQVGGLTIEQATNKIRSSMASTYPALKSGRSQIALNLGNIRSIKVIINGEVNRPGTYTLPSLATVFNALYASGGPNERGSFRNIQVIRNNRIVSTIDVYDFLVNGFQTGNVRLQDQDVIYVPVYQTRVDVQGEVKRSAIFEVLPHETFVDILKFAGGFSDAAYSARIKVSQNTPTERRMVDIPASDFSGYHAKNGDKITVEPILDRYENKVEINGAVFRPGTFELSKGLTLSQLIKQAEGLREDAFMNRGYILRLNADNTNSILSFNLTDVIKPATEADILLQREDVVTISSIFDLRDEYKVTISGEVRKSGTFSYADNMTVKDLILMAGGFSEGANPDNIEISRRLKSTDLSQKSAPLAEIFKVNLDKDLNVSDSGFALQPYDVVIIRSKEGYMPQQQVQIIGEVLQPGFYIIQSKNERISDIIKRAGGLTAFAYSKGASLKRPNNEGAIGFNPVKDSEEDRIRILNLERLSQRGEKDSTDLVNTQEVNMLADLVGIRLNEILKNPQSKFDLLVENGDIIRIPTILQTVKVTGEVLRPVTVTYQPGKSFSYYINNAGGFTKNALKRRSFVSHPNGSVASTTKVLFVNNYPLISPGSVISVPQRATKERMSAQGWVGIGTAVASLAAVLVSILKK